MRSVDFFPDKRFDKACLFFSASSYEHAIHLLEADIFDILMSYHYIKKKQKLVVSELLLEVAAGDGYFMTDSGAFTIISKYFPRLTATKSKYHFRKNPPPDFIFTEEYWIPYIEKYVQFLTDYSSYIYVAANMDLDNIVGRDVVNKWNEKYFAPLQKKMNVVFIAHKDQTGLHGDKTGRKRFLEYCGLYDYVGVNNAWQNDIPYVFKTARHYGNRVHGFALTSFSALREFPFFSVDSTTWLGGSRYGSSYVYDGKNFKTIDYKNKSVRKASFSVLEDLGIPLEDVLPSTTKHKAKVDKIKEDSRAVNLLNLEAWKGARKEYLSAAERKLNTLHIGHYDKR